MSIALAGYVEDAAMLVPYWQKINPEEVFARVADFLPARPSRILDIGAGVGQDAAWFASHGHDVLAVEPVEAFRKAGQANPSAAAVEWLDDSLPDLVALKARRETFDLVMLIAVWAHLDPEQRRAAMPNIASQAAKGGRLIMSIRNGWAPQNRPVFEDTPDETIRLAQEAGLSLVYRNVCGSVMSINRSHNVTWTWLVFERA